MPLGGGVVRLRYGPVPKTKDVIARNLYVKVYLEPYGKSARERLQALVAEAKAGNPFAPVTVVPPNTYAGIGLRRVLAGDGGLLNVGFMALARLAEQLGAPTMASQRRRPLSAASEMAVIRTVAMEMVGKEPLGSVAGHSSLHQSLQEAFKELVRLTEGDLDLLAGEGPLRQATVELYRRFRERTTEYYGPEDEAWAAAEAVRSGRGQPALQDVGALVFFLLTRPSPGEAALLTALSDAAPCSLVVGRTGEADVDDTEGAWWEQFAEAKADSSRQSLADLDARPESIVSAPDAREEVRQAVRDMLQRAEAGVPFHRMAALYRRQDPYAFQLRMELGFAGIRVAGPDPSPLRDSVPGRLLTGMLDVIKEDFSRAALMRWLADAPVWNAASNRSASSELQRWEGLSRQAGVVRGLEQWKERLQGLSSSMAQRRQGAEERGDLTEAQARGYDEAIACAERLLALVEQLAQVSPPADGSPWSAFAKWARNAIDRYGQGKNDWPAQQQNALGSVETTLEELGKLDSVEPATTLTGFQQALNHALSGYMGRSGATGTGVFVAGLSAATGMEFDTVWLLGMSEGDYPDRSGEDPLLPEYVRAQVLKGALPLRREAQLHERRDYLAALTGGERRRLSYSRVDPVTRRSQYPSPWLLEAASTLADERVSSERLHTYDAPWLTVIESMEDALRMAEDGRAADGHEYDVLALARWQRTDSRLRWHPLASDGGTLGRALAMERARATNRLTEWDGYVGGIAGSSRRLGGSLSRVMSPSRLESWATCPYRHFLGSVLNLSAWETPEDVLNISPLERGSLVHAILERFIKEAMDAGAPSPHEVWTPQQRERLREIAQEAFREAEQRGVTGHRVLWEVAQEDILQDLGRFLDDDEQYRADEGMQPRYAEYAFGFDGPPVAMALPDGGEVRFRGFIDRVDVAQDGLRAVVMDYKTGSSRQYDKMKDDPLMAGKRLQLPVYALAVRETLLPDAALRAEYLFISANGGYTRVPVTLDIIEAQFRDTVQAIAEGVRGGVFPANPGSPGFGGPENCRYCDFQRICPTNKLALWARKGDSLQAAAYRMLSGGALDADAEEDAG